MFVVTPNWVRSMFPWVLWQGPASPPPTLYLTFDDGPSPTSTPELLAILQDFDVKATFFVIGREVETHARLIEKVAEAGHTVGNHTYSHTNLLLRSKANIRDELLRADEAIRRVTGKPVKLFRPPYGRIRPSIRHLLREAGYTMVMWSLMLMDFRASVDADEVARRVVLHLHPGAIIVLHEDHRNFANTRRALRSMLQEGLRGGFSFSSLQ